MFSAHTVTGTFDAQRYYVHDRYGDVVRGRGGRRRWFRTYEAAQRFAAALNRGAKRPSGTRP